jgi:hypothetical protein
MESIKIKFIAVRYLPRFCRGIAFPLVIASCGYREAEISIFEIPCRHRKNGKQGGYMK